MPTLDGAGAYWPCVPTVSRVAGSFGGDAGGAVVLSEFGPPGNLAVAEVPDPLPEPGQALVDVHVVSITFVETQVRAGRPPNPAMLPDLPAVLGNGVGGIVAAVGAGASRSSNALSAGSCRPGSRSSKTGPRTAGVPSSYGSGRSGQCSAT